MDNQDTIRRVLLDKQLASFGDSCVNFIYSLALTKARGYPKGTRVSDRILAEAFRLAGLRDVLGTRVARKDLANASEALIAQAYLKQVLTIEESVNVLSPHLDEPVIGLCQLLQLATERLTQLAGQDC